MITNKYVIIWDNIPVGLDSNSGGYPFKTEVPSLIKYWDNIDDARNYMSHFNYHWRLAEIKFEIFKWH